MSKIVYLMGAGASFGKERDSNGNIIEGLPVVNEIPNRLSYIKDILSRSITSEEPIIPPFSNEGKNPKSTIDTITEDFEWLISGVQKHATIDTYAKKLFLTEQHESYEKLKRLLTLFLMTEQIINRPDSRYDTFLANTLQRNEYNHLRINRDIVILTWNYDSQFEIAYKEYLNDNVNIHFPEHLGTQIFNRTENDYYKTIEHNFPDSISEEGQIYKINGSASFYANFSFYKWHSYENGALIESRARKLLASYLDTNPIDGTTYNSYLNFAWEKQGEPYESEYFSKLGEALSEIETMVIIGYTFPFFNREMDLRILNMMRNLNHIYIQDPNANNIRFSIMPFFSQLKSNIKIDVISDVEQFFIPPNLL